MYESEQIPGPYPEHPYSWGGTNAGGYQNPVFDGICQKAMTSFQDTEDYKMNHLEAQKVFSEEVPVLPMYANYRYSIHRPEICVSDMDHDYFGVLINIEQLYSDSSCQ